MFNRHPGNLSAPFEVFSHSISSQQTTSRDKTENNLSSLINAITKKLVQPKLDFLRILQPKNATLSHVTQKIANKENFCIRKKTICAHSDVEVPLPKST